jgi:hypothetical protein
MHRPTPPYQFKAAASPEDDPEGVVLAVEDDQVIAETPVDHVLDDVTDAAAPGRDARTGG